MRMHGILWPLATGHCGTGQYECQSYGHRVHACPKGMLSKEGILCGHRYAYTSRWSATCMYLSLLNMRRSHSMRQAAHRVSGVISMSNHQNLFLHLASFAHSDGQTCPEHRFGLEEHAKRSSS